MLNIPLLVGGSQSSKLVQFTIRVPQACRKRRTNKGKTTVI